MEMHEIYLKVNIWSFDLFSDQLTHKMTLYTIKEVHLGAHILPKVSINYYYKKMYSIRPFLLLECPEVCVRGKTFQILL